MTLPRVPYDPELNAALALFKETLEPEPLVPETIGSFRERFRAAAVDVRDTIAGRAVEHEDVVIPGPAGAPDLTAAVFRPAGGARAAGGIFWIHGGGMILGSRFDDADSIVEAVLELGVVVVAVDYRLAPEDPFPAGIEDCYAGLTWMAENAGELGVDRARIMLRGGSAGGGYSAALALLARDRGGPHVHAQMLICPMIDDRNDSLSVRQFADIGVWNRGFNRTGWDALLGAEARGGPDVSPYASPSRASDLSRLPSAYLEVGSAEIFRDEAVDYATRLWAAGSQAELHVWSGGFHGFATTCPSAPVARQALATRRSWMRRVFA